MGCSYYYFAASLPMLGWEGRAPMAVGEFLSDCRRILEEKDYALVRRLLEEEGGAPGTGNAAAEAWVRFITNFRNEMAWFRAQRLGKDPLKHIRGTRDNDPYARDIIQQASKLADFLQAEKLLDRAVWQFLDDLTIGHYHDIIYIFTYGLKLKILERHQEYHSSRGRSTFDEIRVMEFPESCILESSLK